MSDEALQQRVESLEEVVTPGGARLVPEPERLAEAETFEEFSEWWHQAATLLTELEKLDHQLVEAIRERRRRRLTLHRLRKKARGTRLKEEIWESEDMREAKEAVPEAVEQYNEMHERVEELQEERTQLVRHINANFVAVTEHKGWPDLRGPDEEEIGNAVGRPTGGWDLMPVPTSG